MYPDVSCPSRFLYSIYTDPIKRHNIIQSTIIHNLFFQHIVKKPTKCAKRDLVGYWCRSGPVDISVSFLDWI
jgi:hypothetical protein